MAKRIDPNSLTAAKAQYLRRLAEIASDIYEPGQGAGLKPDIAPSWSRLEKDELRSLGVRPRDIRDASETIFGSNTDFKAGIYKTEKGDIVVAFAGTEGAKDWYHNLKQGAGFESGQYNQAAALARKVAIAGNDVSFTGHSLGGGLATLASAITDKPAVTFNPAGLHSNTLQRQGIDPGKFTEKAENGLVVNVTTKGDALQIANALPLVPSPIGETAKFDGAALQGKNPIARHSMKSVIAVLDEQIEKTPAPPTAPPKSREEYFERGKKLVNQMPDGPAKDRMRASLNEMQGKPPVPAPSKADDFERGD